MDAFGGMSCAEWWAGKPFPEGSEMRKYVCPAWWNQSADTDREFSCPISPGGHFSGCPQFADKAACWERWDREGGRER